LPIHGHEGDVTCDFGVRGKRKKKIAGASSKIGGGEKNAEKQKKMGRNLREKTRNIKSGYRKLIDLTGGEVRSLGVGKIPQFTKWQDLKGKRDGKKNRGGLTWLGKPCKDQ